MTAFPANWTGASALTAHLRDFPPIMLAIPCVAWMWTDAAIAQINLQQHLPPGSVVFRAQGYSDIATARNEIAERFLSLAPQLGLEWLLWLDSDMTPRPETAARLLRSATATGADLMSALCFRRQPPYLLPSNTLPGQDFLECQGVQEVDATGFGCMLMHRRVLETVPRPWFASNTRRPDRGLGDTPVGEDFYHCYTARDHGFKIYVDNDAECGNLSVVSITSEVALAWHATPTGQAQAGAHAFQKIRGEDGSRVPGAGMHH